MNWIRLSCLHVEYASGKKSQTHLWKRTNDIEFIPHCVNSSEVHRYGVSALLCRSNFTMKWADPRTINHQFSRNIVYNAGKNQGITPILDMMKTEIIVFFSTRSINKIGFIIWPQRHIHRFTPAIVSLSTS